MSQFKNILFFFVLLATLITFNACSSAEGDYGGTEYMPDMGHSIAYEANMYNYYYHNTWDSVSVRKLKELSMPRLPVKGTIPRGYAGAKAKDNGFSVAVPMNGSVPYYYENTDTGRIKAINEIIDNPFPITADGLVEGKELYNIYCGICHGEKGDGNGFLARDEAEGGKYPSAPIDFMKDEFMTASNGRYYHAIMYGKGVMGDYTDKLSYEERWQVIHYIHSLQAKKAKATYSEKRNTFNSNTANVPAAALPQLVHEEAHDHQGDMDHEHEEDHEHEVHEDTEHGGEHEH